MRAEAEAARGRKRGLRRGWGKGGILGAIGGEKVGGTKGGAGERSEGARVWTHSATSVTEEVWVAPPSEVYR